MATARKGPDPRIIAGVVFLCAGATFLTLSPGVGIGAAALGIGLIGASAAAGRRKARHKDSTSPGASSGENDRAGNAG